MTYIRGGELNILYYLAILISLIIVLNTSPPPIAMSWSHIMEVGKKLTPSPWITLRKEFQYAQEIAIAW